jgi:uncharacterized protein
VKRLRATGTVAPDLPYGLDNLLSPATAKFLYGADKFDPKALAASLAPHTPVIVSCSSADSAGLVRTGRTDRPGPGPGRRVDPDLVQLSNVDHVLKVDPTGSAANYTKDLPFSPVLKSALRTFVERNL